MTNREKLFKMLGFPVALDVTPASVEVVTDKSTKRKTKPKAADNE